MSFQSHDALVKAVFAQRRHAEGLLKSLLPVAVASRLDWSSLELLPGSFVDPSLRARHTDLLFSVQSPEQSVLLYVLVEHQSTVDPMMPLRAVIYAGRVWDRYLSDHPGDASPPAVLPIVLHHGRKPWSAPTQLREVVCRDRALADGVAERMIQLDLVVHEVSEASCLALHRQGTLTALGTLALLLLDKARQSDDILADLRRWVGLMRVVLSEPSGVAALAMVVQYIVEVTGTPTGDLEALLVSELGPGGEEAFVTGAEQLREEGRMQGLERGLAQGREEGRRAERARLLIKLLDARFGAVARGYAGRVHAADEARVDQWVERVLDAADIDAVFASD